MRHLLLITLLALAGCSTPTPATVESTPHAQETRVKVNHNPLKNRFTDEQWNAMKTVDQLREISKALCETRAQLQPQDNIPECK